MNLTPRQKEIIAILRKETVPLTTIELQKRMGYSQANGPRRHLSALEHMGYIAPRKNHEHRTIMLSEAGKAALGRKVA